MSPVRLGGHGIDPGDQLAVVVPKPHVGGTKLVKQSAV
jgi:hypothetical protein